MVNTRNLIKSGIFIAIGFTVYGMVTVLPAILSEGKISNPQELGNARQFANTMAVISSLGVFAGIATVITGVARKYPTVKKILKIITGYSLYEEMVDNAVRFNLSVDKIMKDRTN